MAGSGRQKETFRRAVKDCQWQSVRRLVLQGCSLEQRDLAVSQAVKHSQWWLVSQLVQLGVSQQHRDLAVHKAVRYCLWSIVEELVSAGVSSEKRDFLLQRALRHGQWGLVSRLLTLGLGPELRDSVVTQALQHGQWETVLDALRLGLRQELVVRIFHEVVSQKRWEHVPSLVNLCKNTDLTDFVLQAAIRSCQWDCVHQLVKTGLTPTQQDLVCREALEWAHFECAVELLRQGCEQGCAERIVLEAFRRNRHRDLADLMREDGVGTNVRKLVFCTAKIHGHLQDYVGILEEIGPKEKEMADIITTSLYSIDVCVILRLLFLSASAQRVFKQVLLCTRFFDHDIIILHTFLMDDHPSLAFYMFTAQEMWENVVGMFEDPRLTSRDRRFALRHASRKGAWNFLEAMARSPSASHCDRRHVFLQAARQGHWMLALSLSAHTSTISLRDRLFAFRTWLHTEIWECVPYVLGQWEKQNSDCFSLLHVYSLSENLFVKCALLESISTNNIHLFNELCPKVRFESDDELFLIETAVIHDRCEFILEFCCDQRSDQLHTAAKQAIEHKKWTVLRDLLIGRGRFWWLDEDFHEGLFLLCAASVSQEDAAWQTVVPALDDFCGHLSSGEALYWDSCEYAFEPDHTEAVHKLSEWCLERSFANVGLALSVLTDNQSCFSRLSDQNTENDPNVFGFCFVVAIKRSNWESAATCLEKIPVDELEDIIVNGLQNEAEFTDVIQACRARRQFNMAVLIGLWTQDWEQIQIDLPQCSDIEVINSVVREACDLDKWDVVQANLDRTSQDSDFLGDILHDAVRHGQFEICTQLMSKVDLRQADFSIRSLFPSAVRSSGDREQMVKMCVQYGLSTHVTSCNCRLAFGCYRCWDSPIKIALHNGQMPLVKLLYKSGACSGVQLYHCKEKSYLRNQLQGQGRNDIVAYLDHVATNPRSLQDLCRLQVSHLIGCHPGREDRVKSLDISWPAKDLINFKDVLP